MSDIFHDYMSRRLDEVNINKIKTKPGPVVTISRAAGCSTQKLAKDLAFKLNSFNESNNWEVISKEVLHESAEKLQLDPRQIKTIFKQKYLNVFEEIAQAFLSSDYHLEKKMRNTVIKVIHRFAVEGNKIILGRAGNIICSDIEEALHIRIDAPLDWRIQRLMKIKEISRDEAYEFIVETENDRINFRKSIKGKDSDSELFDLTINQSIFSNEEIIKLIVKALKIKKII